MVFGCCIVRCRFWRLEFWVLRYRMLRSWMLSFGSPWIMDSIILMLRRLMQRRFYFVIRFVIVLKLENPSWGCLGWDVCWNLEIIIIPCCDFGCCTFSLLRFEMFQYSLVFFFAVVYNFSKKSVSTEQRCWRFCCESGALQDPC